MVDIVANPEWKSVRILERDEVALGGYGGNMNEQATALVARTELLMQEKADTSDIVQGQYSFSTLADFDSKKATIPANSVVIIDEAGANQGMNIWNGTTLTKSDYDPLIQAKDYTDVTASVISASVENKIRTEPTSSDLYQFSDADGNIVALIDKDGFLHAVGLSSPVQTLINDLGNSVAAVEANINNYGVEYAHVFTDVLGNVLATIGLDGKWRVVGLEDDLVTEINKKSTSAEQSEKDTSLMVEREYRDSYKDADKLLSTLAIANTGAKAPAPMHLFKQNFTLNKTWISNIQQFAYSNSTRLTINSPYFQDDGMVHPHILEFYNGFRGYRYIVGMTPYRLANDAYENPCIYGSNDLINFELLTGFDQPLDPRPPQTAGGASAYNSDIVLTYDPRTGELICIWRQTLPNPEAITTRYSALWMRKTKDGINWTAKERIFLDSKNIESNAGGAGSPAILYDVKSGYWYLYLNRLDSSSTALRLFKSKNLNENSWEYVGIVNTGGILGAWHHDVKIIGDKVCILLHQLTTQKNLYFGISDDFLNFTYTPALMTDNDVYKSSFVPIFNSANEISLKILFSTTNSPTSDPDKWRMYVKQTNFINANAEII